MTQPPAGPADADPGTPLPLPVRDQIAIDAVVARVPAWRQAGRIRVAPLEGVVSLNNANYRLTVEGAQGSEDYVLRLAAETVTRHLGVSRHEEGAAASAAARAGIAPAVVYFDAVTGHMVTRRVPGRHWGAEEFREAGNLARLAATLRRLHALRDVPAQGPSIYRRVERLLESARSLGLETPADLGAHEQGLRRLEQRRQAEVRAAPGLCHQDLWANNFLDDGQDLWLVDWEFAGAGDGLYDLATVSLAGGYSPAQQRELLAAYGDGGRGDLASLRGMEYAVFFFEAAWALVQHGLRGSSPPGFDYLGYARRRFRSLQERLATGGI